MAENGGEIEVETARLQPLRTTTSFVTTLLVLQTQTRAREWTEWWRRSPRWSGKRSDQPALSFTLVHKLHSVI